MRQVDFSQWNKYKEGLPMIVMLGNSEAVPEDCALCIFYCEEMEQSPRAFLKERSSLENPTSLSASC